MATDPGPSRPGAEATSTTHKLVTATKVLKMCLPQALSRELLPSQRDAILERVATYSELISRMSRRASMILLHYVTCLLHADQPLPDFDDQKDSYWHDWLKIGLREFADKNGDNAPMPNEGVRPYYNMVAATVGSTIRGGDLVAEVPEYFSRIIGHAAIQFKTVFGNCQEVHFWDKLGRLCKLVGGQQSPKITGYTLLQALRRDEAQDDWSDEVIQCFLFRCGTVVCSCIFLYRASGNG
jgi:hypothetical protein